MAANSSTSEPSNEYSPLTPSCVKFLTDKLEDKRKVAASEIEKMTFEFSIANNESLVKRLIIILGRKFCLSQVPNARKGGLLGLAAVMIGFKNGSVNELPQEIVDEVVRPILTCFLDPDPSVRYYACEALYNVTKVAQSKILPLFEAIFDCLAKIVADKDIHVKIGAESLDKLLKDIIIEQKKLQIDSFVENLQEYIYSKNPFTSMFIISWIRLLDSKIDMIVHLPNLLDGIFNCLYDSTEEIRASTLALLQELLDKILIRPTDKIDLPSLIKILLKHAKNTNEDVAQYTAISWLKQFIGLMDDKGLIEFAPGMLSATLPCLAVHTSPDSTQISASPSSNNQRYMSPCSNRSSICEIASLVNSSLLEQITTLFDDRRKIGSSSSPNGNELEPILDVLIEQIQKHEHPVIKLAVLEWFKRIKKAEPNVPLTSTSQPKLFQTLLETLSTRSDNVVKNALRVLADWFCFHSPEEQQVATNEIDDNPSVVKDEDTSDLDKRKSPVRSQFASPRTPGGTLKRVAIVTSDIQTVQKSTTNVNVLIQALCQLFQEKEQVFDDRGTFIISNLCTMVRPDMIYRSFAEIINDDKTDPRMAFNLVQKLNQILMTTQPLFSLRSRMSNDDDPEMVSLFYTLYYAWCHSPIAVLTLCLLTNNYKQANGIVMALSQSDTNLDILTQIDWVVQLIESPVFSSLRMKLIDPYSNQYLLQSLYGLLMILPQSEAYKRLSHRLDQAYKYMCSQQCFKSANPSVVAKPTSTNPKDTKKTGSPATSYESLMKHYLQAQNQRVKHSRFIEKDD